MRRGFEAIVPVAAVIGLAVASCGEDYDNEISVNPPNPAAVEGMSHLVLPYPQTPEEEAAIVEMIGRQEDMISGDLGRTVKITCQADASPDQRGAVGSPNMILDCVVELAE